MHKLTRNNSLCWPSIPISSWQKSKNKYLKTIKLSFSLYVHPYFISRIKCTFYGNMTCVRNMLISQLAVIFCNVNRISHIEETEGYKKNMVGKWGKTGLGRRKKRGPGCSTICYISNQALLLHLSDHTRGMRIRSDMSSIPNPHLHDGSSSTWRLKCRCAFSFQ